MSLACECGFPDRSFYHLVYDCPVTACGARQIAAHHADWHQMDPQELLGTKTAHRTMFIIFLAQSRAAFTPLTRPAVPFDPG